MHSTVQQIYIIVISPQFVVSMQFVKQTAITTTNDQNILIKSTHYLLFLQQFLYTSFPNSWLFGMYKQLINGHRNNSRLIFR